MSGRRGRAYAWIAVGVILAAVAVRAALEADWWRCSVLLVVGVCWISCRREWINGGLR